MKYNADLKKPFLIALSGLSFLVFVPLIAYLTLNFGRELCSLVAPARDEFGRKTIRLPETTDDSYVLFSPFSPRQRAVVPGRVYLTDLNGRIAHSWETRYQTLYASLKRDGHLVAALINPGDPLADPGGGGTGTIQELDWEGNVLWQYEDPMLHHDFDVLPDGRIAALVWEKMSPDNAAKIRGGMNGEAHADFWADAIVEIDANGKEVWRWSAAQNLDIGKYVLGPLVPRNEWTYGNSVRYYETNPFSGKPAYLLSLRHLNRVFVIERESGRVLWESKENMLASQHDATLLKNGNILIFDNGLLRAQQRPGQWSRVVEINPIENTIVWEFNGGKTGIEKAKFSSSIMSGAQRLRNGNTFIVNAVNGHFLEVLDDGRIVWDFINPYLAPSSGSFGNNIVFKARRYSPSEINWPERLPDPMGGIMSRVYCGG